MRENYYATKGLPWSCGIGQQVTDCKTAKEVMEQSKLDFTVEKCPLVAEMPFTLNGSNDLREDSSDFVHEGRIYRECPKVYGTYRTDINAPLGIVKSKYEIVQNRDAFDFFDEVVGAGMAEYQYAGYYGYGEKVFITAKINSDFDVNGDPVESYLVFSNSHDGSGSVNILFAPIRVFCTNMLNSATDNADSYIKIRHTRTAREKLEKGKEVFRIACEHAESSKVLYEALRAVDMDDMAVKAFLANLILSAEEKAKLYAYDSRFGYEKLYSRFYGCLEATGISMRKANKIVAMWEYYNNGFGQKQIAGTAWGVYNAVTGYYSNMENNTGEKRMESLCYGTANRTCNVALNGLAEYAKSA